MKKGQKQKTVEVVTLEDQVNRLRLLFIYNVANTIAVMLILALIAGLALNFTSRRADTEHLQKTTNIDICAILGEIPPGRSPAIDKSKRDLNCPTYIPHSSRPTSTPTSSPNPG